MEPDAQLDGKQNARLPAPDFRALFDAAPGLYLVLQPDEPIYTIVAVNKAYSRATLTNADEIIGRGLFEVFPHNPDDDRQATGVRNLQASLRRVIATKAADTMAVQKYDIRRPDSRSPEFEERYWSPVNFPLLGPDGNVQFIIHRVEDVTELLSSQRIEADQGRVKDELGLRADQMEAEPFLRSRELAQVKQLTEERRLLSLLVENSPDAIAILDLHGVPVYANQSYLTLVGAADFAELGQISVSDCFVQEERAFVQGVALPAVCNQGRWQGELHIQRLRTPDTIPVLFEAFRVDDPATGQSSHVATIARDLRERRLSEEKLREIEARFSLAFAEAPIGMVLATPGGKIVEMNQAFLEMLGYTREELVGHDSASFSHPDDIAPTREFFASLQHASRATSAIEKRYLRKGGELLWARASAAMRRDGQGKPVQIIAIIEDITERKRAEAQLRESRERLRAIYDGTYEYIGLLAPDGTLLEANRASLEFAGNSREDVVGRPFWDTPWFTPTPGAPELVRQGVARAAAGEFVRYEANLQRPSGEFTTFDISLHPVRNEHGEVVLIVPEGRDVTDRKALERRDAFLVRLDDATRSLVDPDEIMRSVARLLGEYLRGDRCAYCTFQPDQDTLDVEWDYTRPGMPSVVGRYILSDFGAEAVRLLRLNLPFVVEDIESDPRTADVRAAYRQVSIVSHATVPLHKAERLVALMFVHQQAPRQWLPEETELLSLVANRCWESIERVRVTRALRESERRLRLAQRAGRIGSFEWLLKEDRIIWTPELEALYGLPEGTFEGTLNDWSRRVVAEDAELVIKGIRKCLSRREPECAYEFRALLPDGTIRWLRTQAQFFYTQSGAPERMVGVDIDIDAQKQAESHLRQQWHTFDTALSHTPDFTYTFDLEGRFTYVNRALLSLWQLPLEAALGKNFFDLGYPPDLAERLQHQIKRVIATREPIRDQTPFTGPTGETRHYEYIFVPVLAEDGQVEAVAGSTRDITEQKQAQEQERERQEHLRETARLESLGVMAGGIAHDFNNLLTGILGNASLLVDDAQEPDRAIAGEIVLAAERAADLTRQMLAFSGRGRFFIEVFDVNTLIQENLTLLRASLSRSASVVLELGHEACLIEGDRGQIQQVIMNLLINGSEAIGDRPGTLAIRTAVTERAVSRFSAPLQAVVSPGRYVLLEVRDNGIGMAAETLKKMFDPFFTTKFTGRGLGLAAVLGIVRGHQGDIEVVSQPGSGTTLRIFLPATARAGEPRREPASAVEGRATGQTVLVVDDEETVRKTANAALESRGFRVILATNGLEALDILRHDAGIALVLLDLTMPVMTGEQAIPLIKAINSSIPIILSSGLNEADVLRRFASSGITAVLQKPYTVSAIISKVTDALKASRVGLTIAQDSKIG